MQLAYAFTTPDGGPIRASALGTNSNLIDLLIIVSTVDTSLVELTKITIQIPCGSDDQQDLSSNANLPQAEFDTPNSDWTASSSGGTVTLWPQPEGQPAVAITSGVLVTIPGIAVNDTSGIVNITVTEYPASGGTNPGTYPLVKAPAAFPTVGFSATPQALNAPDQPVTLYWTFSDPDACTDAGYTFTLSSEAGVTYQCSDGVNGVVIPSVTQTTTFILSVWQVGSEDSVEVATLTTTVQMDAPYLSPNCYLEASYWGWRVDLYWLAFNAAYCEVYVDGNPILGPNKQPLQLTVNTYQNGYTVNMASAEPEPHTLSVIAYAQSGTATASFNFVPVNTEALTTIAVGFRPIDIAITPDGKLALVSNNSVSTQGVGSLSVIDISTLTAEPNPISVTGMTNYLVITSDSAYAFVTESFGQVVKVDINGRKVDGDPLTVEPYAVSAGGIAITNDGQQVLVVDGGQSTVKVIDPTTFAVTKTIPLGMSAANFSTTANGIAVTPDNSHALAVNTKDNAVAVIDMATLTAEPKTISTPNPADVAVTPDRTLALVSNFFNNTITFIDMPTLTVESNQIRGGGSPTGIAISPDSNLAFVANRLTNVMLVVDIKNRAVGARIPVGQGPTSVAITPDGTLALVTNSGDNTVSVLKIVPGS
jgi:YVTN family beta-propeller protein